ncbi:hypothetical protein BpHYR1_034025 [Brachionus plicatilis]|uniref:Uncharacterized protein n=1 Tax=Brachionus plicatilis TaxID=10195 RepID=A0A3M7PIM0_BRAPC|nr:hypothetical protein BpHYR1_034025 [Brachionus plicatilis]
MNPSLIVLKLRFNKISMNKTKLTNKYLRLTKIKNQSNLFKVDINVYLRPKAGIIHYRSQSNIGTYIKQQQLAFISLVFGPPKNKIILLFSQKISQLMRPPAKKLPIKYISGKKEEIVRYSLYHDSKPALHSSTSLTTNGTE